MERMGSMNGARFIAAVSGRGEGSVKMPGLTSVSSDRPSVEKV